MKTLSHKFVKHIPEEIEEGILYISIEYYIVIHKCCCGCGYQVVTPLTPTDWQLTLDSERISLSPSIGNWSFPCQSHYWIRNNKVIWDKKCSKKKIGLERKKTSRKKGTVKGNLKRILKMFF